ncbi:MAG: 4-(cytidine 5'-diphospho)-2-C-methyl-D-erythritol kinase [Longimicrobiales bacterium]
MISNAPAKLNLFLHILAREATGFHQIETLFCALELCDELEVERSTHGIALDVKGTSIPLTPNPRDNLVHRAATAFFAATGLDGGTRITLTKCIPAGAGLGGGSSDAAATLAALNEIYGRPLTAQQLITIGAALGSDIPFFMCGSPLALAWGRGTRIVPLSPLPQRAVVLVAPAASVSTADAYRALADSRPADFAAPPAIIHTAAASEWDDVAYNAVNDFESVIFDRIPELAPIKADLIRHGAHPALLTGSGSVVFGVFASDAAADAAADAIRADFRNIQVIVTRTAAPYSASAAALA